MDDSATGIRHMRPMGITELIDATFTLYRNNFALFAGVVAVLAIPRTILDMIFISQIPSTTTVINSTSPATTTTFNTVTQTYSTAVLQGTGTGIIGGIFSVLIMGALTQAMAARYLDRPETIPGAYADTGVATFVRMFLALILGIVALVLAAALVVILIVLAVTVGGGSVPLILLAVLLGLAAIVAFMYISPHLYLVLQVIVLERLGIFASVRRSWFLIHGSYWRVVGLVFLVQLMVGILSGIISGVVELAAFSNPVLATGVNGVLGIILQPISLGVFTLLYFDQRVRKEGFDLEYAAQQMALAPQ